MQPTITNNSNHQLREQMKLEKEHLELLKQLQELRVSHVPPRTRSQAGESEHHDTFTFLVMEHFDAQGNLWHNHLGFDFTLVKEIKQAVTTYGATAPYSHPCGNHIRTVVHSLGLV